MGVDKSKPMPPVPITTNELPLEISSPVLKNKIPPKKIKYRKIIKKDKVINFNNIEKFVSEKDPEKAFEYLKLDLDKYEVIYF